MAHIATIRVLVADRDAARVEAGLAEMLRTAQHPVEEGGERWLADWSIQSVEQANPTLTARVAKGDYDEGEFVRDTVIFSASEARADEGCGFWSNEFGWSSLDLATKFDGRNAGLPLSSGDDAVWMTAPYGLNFHRVMLVEFPQDGGLDQTPIAFECWAETLDHAQEQARNAYPGCALC